jgi:hypothetical protein
VERYYIMLGYVYKYKLKAKIEDLSMGKTSGPNFGVSSCKILMPLSSGAFSRLRYFVH